MASSTNTLSTAERRIPHVVESALMKFADVGYPGTKVADVAADAGISPAYVFKLFPSKEQLFVAALDRCFELVLAALNSAADSAAGKASADILDAMGEAYARLIADRTLLMLQVHALSVAQIPEIGDALRRGLAQVTRTAQERSGAENSEVQRFIAYGQLCHLIVTAELDHQSEDWASLLSEGIRHY